MVAQGAGKRQFLFGVGAIHESPLPESDLFGHGPCVVRVIHDSPLPQSARLARPQFVVGAIHESPLRVVGWDEEKYQRLCQGLVDHP